MDSGFYINIVKYFEGVRMKTNCRIISVFLIIFLVVSGCTHHFMFATTSFELDLPSYSQENVVLLLTPDYCDSSYIMGDVGQLTFELGPTLCANSEKLVKLIYSDVLVVKETSTDKLEKASLIIKPNLLNKLIKYTHFPPKSVSSLLVVKWEITDAKGKLISKKTIRGSGREASHFGGDIFGKSVQQAIDSLFIKSAQYFSSAKELRQAIK